MSTLGQAALDEIENPTLAYDRAAKQDRAGNEVALHAALTGQLSPLAARCVAWNRKFSPLCRNPAQDRNPNPQSKEPTMSFAQRHPYAGHITVMDGAPLPTRPTPMQYGQMPPRGGGGASDPDIVNGGNGNGNGYGYGRSNGRDPRNPSNLSSPDAFRRGLNSGGDQTSPRPASVSSPSGYSGGLSRSRPPSISDQEENNGEEDTPPNMTPDDLVDVIRLILPRLSPAGRASFVGNLSTLLAGLEHMNGNTNGGNGNGGNGQQYDSRSGSRSGNRTAADRALAADAAEAKRAMQSRDFLGRFPEMARVRTGNYISRY
jgi:hypothetical protein